MVKKKKFAQKPQASGHYPKPLVCHKCGKRFKTKGGYTSHKFSYDACNKRRDKEQKKAWMASIQHDILIKVAAAFDGICKTKINWRNALKKDNTFDYDKIAGVLEFTIKNVQFAIHVVEDSLVILRGHAYNVTSNRIKLLLASPTIFEDVREEIYTTIKKYLKSELAKSKRMVKKFAKDIDVVDELFE